MAEDRTDIYNEQYRKYVERHVWKWIRYLEKYGIFYLEENYEMDDLIQAGWVALLHALGNYREDMGAKFTTYAFREVHEAIGKEVRFQLKTRKMDEVPEDLTGEDSIEQFMDGNELEECRQMLSFLNDKELQALKDFYGIEAEKRLNYKEVGKKLGMSEYEAEELVVDSLKKLRDVFHIKEEG